MYLSVFCVQDIIVSNKLKTILKDSLLRFLWSKIIRKLLFFPALKIFNKFLL
ncbi:hypothetical protein HMPREF1866_01283 [Lachnoanaerobaculum saburreum]|uniref:Uncharacterized protein n=1 Tax=Lachnoanaerobaculum saburreum TaxID=467210 RepID=A0A133ZQS5_9FIRM|nr:hypothetical protein HMPREF1866_01283 [Lachnoanaerobaculum saburreum]